MARLTCPALAGPTARYRSAADRLRDAVAKAWVPFKEKEERRTWKTMR